MSRSNVFFLFVAILATAAALWYRSQIPRQSHAVVATPKIAFVTGGSGPYWQLTASGARSAAKEYKCELDIRMPADAENLAEQMTLLAGLDLETVNGIAVSPLDAAGQTKMINRMQQRANIVTFDSDAPLSTRRGHIGTSNYGAGRTCARLTAEAIPDGGKVLVLLANFTKENLLDRSVGFKDTVNKEFADNSEESTTPFLEVIDYLADEGKSEKTKENIRETLKKHPDLACIVGMNARHGPVILEVLKEENKLGEIKVVAFDEVEETLNGIEAGYIYATIAQDPYKFGFETVRMLAGLCRSGGSEVPIVGGGTVNINAEAVRKEDLKKFRERLESRVKVADK